VLRVNANQGAAVTLDETSINQLVRAGQPAVLVVRDGGVALTADVVARTSGGLGEQVAVYNPDTHRELSGVVTGPGQVEVTLMGDQSQ
jgi:flagella basal body P-ring formation protein FlgA